MNRYKVEVVVEVPEGGVDEVGTAFVHRGNFWRPKAVERIEPPLPTAPGSVVKADTPWGKGLTLVLRYSAPLDQYFWQGVILDHGGWVSSSLSNVTVLFDAGAEG